jgi:hypothetical protein
MQRGAVGDSTRLDLTPDGLRKRMLTRTLWEMNIRQEITS